MSTSAMNQTGSVSPAEKPPRTEEPPGQEQAGRAKRSWQPPSFSRRLRNRLRWLALSVRRRCWLIRRAISDSPRPISGMLHKHPRLGTACLLFALTAAAMIVWRSSRTKKTPSEEILPVTELDEVRVYPANDSVDPLAGAPQPAPSAARSVSPGVGSVSASSVKTGKAGKADPRFSPQHRLSSAQTGTGRTDGGAAHARRRPAWLLGRVEPTPESPPQSSLSIRPIGHQADSGRPLHPAKKTTSPRFQRRR